MKSRNIVFPEPGHVELLEEDVAPLNPGEVLCRALLSLVSLGTEGNCLRGVYDPGTYWEEYIRYPFHPGYSMAAIVVAVGEGVTRHRIGERVTSWAPHSEYFVQPEDQLFAVPEGLRDKEAVWATLARTTQIAVRRAELVLGETAVVVGLGVLGQLVTQYLRLCGAHRVIVIDTAQKRLDLASANGATHAIALPVGDAREEVARITRGKMADVVFDVTGHPAVLAPASLLLRKLGRLVLLGDSPTPSLQHLGPRIVGDSIAILGIHGMMYPDLATPFNQWTAEAMTALFFDFVQSKRMNVASLVTHRLSPLDADEVYNTIARQPDAALGVLFDWSRLPDLAGAAG
jgi:2-desacetyl-2-hydroxyethyl bacteriochlorophyllide A dehydrogenase